LWIHCKSATSPALSLLPERTLHVSSSDDGDDGKADSLIAIAHRLTTAPQQKSKLSVSKWQPWMEFLPALASLIISMATNLTKSTVFFTKVKKGTCTYARSLALLIYHDKAK